MAEPPKADEATREVASRRLAPSLIERWLLALLGAAVVVGAVVGMLRERPSARHEDLLGAAREGYSELWREFDGAAATAAKRLGGVDLATATALELFEMAVANLPAKGGRDWALYLLDPSGRLRAWSGAGLLHPLDPSALPGAGRAYRASLTAASLLSIVGLEEHPGWRVVVGASLETATLPFALPGNAHVDTLWGLAAIGDTGPGGRAAILLADTPTLLIDDAGLAEGTRAGPRPWYLEPSAWLGAWLLLAATSFRRRLGPWTGLFVALGLVCWGFAAGAQLGMLAVLAAVTLVAFSSAGVASHRSTRAHGPLLGVAGAAALAGLAWALQYSNPLDLVGHFFEGGAISVHRAILFLAAMGWVGLLVRGAASSVEVQGGNRSVWLAALALTAAACTTDWPGLSLALLLAGGGLLGSAVGGRSLRRRPLVLAGLVITAAFTAAVANELAYGAAVRVDLAGPRLAALAPPTQEETAADRESLDAYFDRFDLADLTAANLADLDRTDLAYQLWRQSPLARGRAVSAVELRGYDGERHLFTFGIPLDSRGRPQVQSRERIFDRPVWDYVLVNEGAPVLLDQEPWGEVEYWLLVRPGHRLAPGRLGDVSVDLLHGGPSGRGAVQGLVRPARYAFYTNAQRARISPWMEPPTLPDALLPGGPQGTIGGGQIVTPDGPSWVWTAAEPEGFRALFLPRLGPMESFERVGRHTLGALWPIAVLLVVAFVLSLSRSEFRARIAGLWRSYSRRLVLVFSFLVLAPVVVVDVLVLRVLTDRLEEEKLAKARGAMSAAQRVLGEYASVQQSGMSIDTLLDDDLMSWLSQVLDHEVNLYWVPSRQVSASSRQELFAAGLLPRRVPGEILSALRLRGQRLASRRARTGRTEYTELYAPLALPGEDPQSARFLISIPLLAQEAEVAAEIEGLRHNVVLATAILVFLLVALGARLAASFTKPLEELVEGTQRIAGGAERLDMKPKEQELATLVEAIDRMAERVADGRRKLMLEKRVVERMVDNITAAVVSIDGDHQVIMQNEVAGRLLGTVVGESLETALRGDTLGKVLEGLQRSEELGVAQTISLAAEDEGETREWSLVWVPIPGEGEPKALVVVEDVTEVIRGQRLQAWAEMARMIAHEIKNPLTPIRLSAEHMREVRQRDPAGLDRIFDQCVDNILRHVEELRVISTEFSTYSRIPKIDPAVGDLTQQVRGLVAGYQSSPPAGIEIAFEAPPDPIWVSFDGRLLTRALRNLLENALRASAGGGKVSVEMRAEKGGAEILVSDTGTGVAPDQLGRIFDPYFSTHDSGTGLGLPIARRIIEEHGGEIHARNRAGGGLVVRVTLPARPLAGSATVAEL
jgi:signal transduction histidine kinase